MPLIKAQDSYILRGNTSNVPNTPPPPPTIKPNTIDAKKKTITTKNPGIEAAKPSPKTPSTRDSNPNVGDINASTPAPKAPKNGEVKPKSEKPVVAATPQNTPKPSVETPNNPKPANTSTPTNTSTPKPASTNTNAPKTPTSTNTTTPKPAATATNTNAPKTPTTNTTTANAPKNPTNTSLTNAPKNTTSPVTPAPTPALVEVSAEVAAKNAKLLRVAADTAKAYIGTVYLTGGMTREGVDCSGLVNLAYKNTGVKIPRTSRDLSEFGTEIKDVTDIKIGDLLFFDSNDSKRINHVAIVTRITPEQIFFIHATCTKGVREDKLLAGYWTPKHRKTMRILPN